ncbi:hypothetical protein D3C71_1306250 [compost metagenome]
MRRADKYFIGKPSQYVNSLLSSLRKWHGSQDPNGQTARTTGGHQILHEGESTMTQNENAIGFHRTLRVESGGGFERRTDLVLIKLLEIESQDGLMLG